MKQIVLFTVIISVLITHNATAQRIKDFSMSERDSLRQESINNAPSGNYGQFMNPQSNTGGGIGVVGSGGRYRGGGGIGQGLNSSNANTSMPTKAAINFMTGFCDENFKPLLSNTGRIAELNTCIEQYKTEACDLFFGLPQDVQNTMDEWLACLHGNANADAAPKDCTAYDSTKLGMIKTHWTNQDTVYSIIFLSDLVFESPSNCMSGG